jgi:hypothetical protein
MSLSDTSTQIEHMQLERFRQMPTWRKLALVAEMNQTVRALAVAGLRQRYPADTARQQQRRLADLMLGAELATRVYGPGPEVAHAG